MSHTHVSFAAPDYSQNATFTASATSAAFDTRNTTLAGLFIPAGFVGTSIKFLVSSSLTGTYAILTDESGSDISVTVAASKPVSLGATMTKLRGYRYIQLRSSASETATVPYITRANS